MSGRPTVNNLSSSFEVDETVTVQAKQARILSWMVYNQPVTESELCDMFTYENNTIRQILEMSIKDGKLIKTDDGYVVAD